MKTICQIITSSQFFFRGQYSTRQKSINGVFSCLNFAAEACAKELVRVLLQAILLADGFAQKFRPITLERLKVVLPLVKVPMIDYTLACLEFAGIEEVFAFCFFSLAHEKQTDWLQVFPIFFSDLPSKFFLLLCQIQDFFNS